MPPLLPPLLFPPLFLRPMQIAVGVALGWMLRGRHDSGRRPAAGAPMPPVGD